MPTRNADKHALPLLWKNLIILGVAWPIFITSKEHHPAIDGNEGLADFSNGQILISSKVSDERKPEVLVHEILHVILFSIGFESIAGSLLGTDASWDNKEEAIVASISPVLYDILTRNDWLKIPAPPATKPKTRIRKTTKGT